MKYIFSCGNRHQYEVEMPMGEEWSVICPDCGEWGTKDFRANALTQSINQGFNRRWFIDESGKEKSEEFPRRKESREAELRQWREGKLKGRLVSGPVVTYVDPEV